MEPFVKIWSRGELAYSDTADHFDNGLLRLMQITATDVRRWMDLAEGAEGELIEKLAAGWRALRRIDSASGGASVGPRDIQGHVIHRSIGRSPDFGFAIADDGSLGWLVRADGTREADPPPYGADYFEGTPSVQGSGYGIYGGQAGWRLEKSARLVAEMLKVTGLENGRVLDAGSGYGYFRVALETAGYTHDGLDFSEFARQAQRERYGFETFAGELADFYQGWKGRYDAITAHDVVEHLSDIDPFLTQAAYCLRPGGYLGLRTPNIDCPEAFVFGPDFHSLRRDHLVYFTPRSLIAAAERAGFELVQVTTTSHLLVGFVGQEQVSRWEAEERGDNIEAWFKLS